uniref:Outer membrane protein beta-barrel domain-containing protein n=1 Tax=Solibacter usitatus (strain Ellin6076) TaxID=234267 RepID=Q01UB9_SOLUE
MRKIITVIAALPFLALVAGATDAPKAEAFVGYNFVRFNPNSQFLPSLNANGGGGQFVYNFSKWVGGVVDLGAVTKGTINGFNVDATVVNFVAGPRFTYFNHSRFQPYVQALFGGAYSTASAQINLLDGPGGTLPPGFVLPPNVPISARLVAARTGFAMFAGGGLDIKINKHMSFRPIGADYYLVRLPAFITGNDTNHNNFRYSAGVNFLFGAQ